MKAPKIVEQIVQITMDGDTARAEIIGELTRCKDCGADMRKETEDE